jgi:hypothetical protein
MQVVVVVKEALNMVIVTVMPIVVQEGSIASLPVHC